jgi:hypothetical protein
VGVRLHARAAPAARARLEAHETRRLHRPATSTSTIAPGACRRAPRCSRRW